MATTADPSIVHHVVISELSDDGEIVQSFNNETAAAMVPGVETSRLTTTASFLALFDKVVDLEGLVAPFNIVYIGHGSGDSLCFRDGPLTPTAFREHLVGLGEQRLERGRVSRVSITLVLEACYGHNFREAMASDVIFLSKYRNVLELKIKTAASDSAATVDMTRVIGGGGMDRLMLNTVEDFAAMLAKAIAEKHNAQLSELLYVMKASEFFYDRVTSTTIGEAHAWAYRGDFVGKTAKQVCDKHGSEKLRLLLSSYDVLAAAALTDPQFSLRFHAGDRIEPANAFISLLQRLEDGRATAAEKEDAIDMGLLDNPTRRPCGIRRMVIRRSRDRK